MSVRTYLLKHRFVIRNKNIRPALAAINERWPETGNLCDRLEQDAGLCAEKDRRGVHVYDIRPDGLQPDFEEFLMDVIAPYVEGGSFLTMMEDEPEYRFFQFYFDGSHCYFRNVELVGIPSKNEHRKARRNARRKSQSDVQSSR